jgi:hypothetical protein
MTYRVLLIVPTNLPNWLLVLPPLNRLNTCSVSIQVFRSIFIDLIWSSRFKIMVNSNLKLLQLWFMIPSAVHTWCDYGQHHLTPLPNSLRLRQILERIYFRHTSSNFQYFWLFEVLLHPGFLLTPIYMAYFIQTQSLLSPLDFCNGLWTYYLLTVRSPWLNYKSWSVFLLRLSNGFSKKSAVYPHNCRYPVQILR